MPRSNRGYWEPKLARNVERDRTNDAVLQESGWAVLRFYEHFEVGEAARIVHDTVKGSVRDAADALSSPPDRRGIQGEVDSVL